MADPATFEELPDAAAADALPGKIAARRRLEETEMDITPMIDCTFLLLIFFLLTFKASEGATIPLPPAKYGVPVPAKNAVVLTVEQGEPDQPARVYLGNTTDASALADASDLEALEGAITAYVERETARTGKDFVLIKAAENVKHRDVARVARAASRVAKVQQLHVAVLEVQ
jgi:biopolymer transport protein TolR